MSQSIQERFPRAQTLTSESPDLSKPPIICFHGSGESCAGWSDLAQLLIQESYRVLLYDRGPDNPKPDATTLARMVSHISGAGLRPPYILVAHSYGGAFAREFLRLYPLNVAGMVLVETGQETAIDSALEEDQYRRQIMGKRPLSVIRGNSFIDKFAQFELKLKAAEGVLQRRQIRNDPAFKLLKVMDKEDERLKKRQLALSCNSRYVHIPDCGHGVVQHRPRAVADEVSWVMEQQSLVDYGDIDDYDVVSETREETRNAWKRVLRNVTRSK